MSNFKSKYIKDRYINAERNIHRQIEPGVYIYMQSFNRNNVGYRFTMERFEGAELKEKLTAQNIRWDEETEKWVINSYWKRVIHDDYEELSKGYRMDTTLNMTPGDFKRLKNEMETYMTPALLDEIEMMKMRGVNYVEWDIEKHKRMANPFSAFVLTIIGAGLASRKVKGGLGLHLGIGLALAFSYILFMQISTVFAVSGSTSAFVAVWIPNMVFGVFAVFVYRWASR
jgi:lipopolysaccharide export system permease protein